MKNIFYQNQQTNSFDNLVIDISRLYDNYPIGKGQDAKPNSFPLIQSPVHGIYRNFLLPLKFRRCIYHGLRRTNLDQSWFEEFKKYWSEVLSGRPLHGLHDLFFLKNLYRVKFQNSQVPDTDNANIHFEAWQRPELIYQLLHLVCRQYTSDQLRILQHLKKLDLNISRATILEFGCAIAPVTTSLFEFFRMRPEAQIYISDIQTLAFHYAAYRFRECSNVTPVLLRPENDFALDIDVNFDVIFCMAVFEHLNKPLETMRKFYNRLQQGGYFFFDYIKGDGQGLDTHHGVRQRNDVLEYVQQNFDLIYGTLDKEKNTGLTIVRKR